MNYQDSPTIASDYNFNIRSAGFYRYQHRSCTDESGVQRELTDCGDLKDISQFDSQYCAEWMEWNSWADCALEKRVEETDLLLLAEDADLNFEVYTRKRTRDCNIEGACDEAPNLDRKAAKIIPCCSKFQKDMV